MSFKPEHLMLVFFFFSFLGIFVHGSFFFIAILVLPIMFYLFKATSKHDKEITINQAEKIFNQHGIRKYHIGEDNLSCVGIDESQNIIILLTRMELKDNFNINLLSFQHIIEVKLIEDDLTLTSVSRASQIGGAIAGGLLAGGIGAIVGGSGGTQYSEKEVRKIDLEIIIDSLDNPIQKVSFMNEDLFIKKYEKKYKEKFEEANYWYRLFSVILKRNEKEYKYL